MLFRSWDRAIGLAKAGGEALELAKSIYVDALGRKEELCGPYADVIDIDMSKLPTPAEVNAWSSEKYVNTLTHIQSNPDYNVNFRQLIHVSYKLAAEQGPVYYDLLEKYADIIGACVEENIYERHFKRIFNL